MHKPTGFPGDLRHRRRSVEDFLLGRSAGEPPAESGKHPVLKTTKSSKKTNVGMLYGFFENKIIPKEHGKLYHKVITMDNKDNQTVNANPVNPNQKILVFAKARSMDVAVLALSPMSVHESPVFFMPFSRKLSII